MSSPSIRRDKGARHMSAQVNYASESDPFDLRYLHLTSPQNNSRV